MTRACLDVHHDPIVPARSAWLRVPFRRTTLRRRRDGVVEVARVRPLVRWAVVLVAGSLALPVVAVTALALVIVRPALLCAVPAAALCAGVLLISSRAGHERRQAGTASVVPFPRPR